jgi:Phosphatidylinositol 3- and 4-kinase
VSYTDPDAPQIVRDMNQRAFTTGAHDGVELKEWVRGPDGAFWLAKTAEAQSGDIGQPLHEALMPLLCAAIGVEANEVALGHRNFAPRPNVGVSTGPRPASYHRYRSGTVRELAGPMTATPRFFADYAAMALLDLVVGNTDRHPRNYMVDAAGRLFAIDNGRSLGRGFLGQVLQEAQLDALASSGGRESQPWSAEYFPMLATRFGGLAAEIDVAIASLPRSWRRLHDLAVAAAPAEYQAELLARKADILKRNVTQAVAWLAARGI